MLRDSPSGVPQHEAFKQTKMPPAGASRWRMLTPLTPGYLLR